MNLLIYTSFTYTYSRTSYHVIKHHLNHSGLNYDTMYLVADVKTFNDIRFDFNGSIQCYPKILPVSAFNYSSCLQLLVDTNPEGVLLFKGTGELYSNFVDKFSNLCSELNIQSVKVYTV